MRAIARGEFFRERGPGPDRRRADVAPTLKWVSHGVFAAAPRGLGGNRARAVLTGLLPQPRRGQGSSSSLLSSRPNVPTPAARALS